jgi:hypothetical protein
MFGAFEAPILDVLIDITELTAREHGDLPFGDLYLTLGAGLMDRSLSRLAGVGSRRTRGGSYAMTLDYVDPFVEELDQAAWARQGDWNGSDLRITVPEPTSLAMAVLGGAAVWRRRRARRQ